MLTFESCHIIARSKTCPRRVSDTVDVAVPIEPAPPAPSSPPEGAADAKGICIVQTPGRAGVLGSTVELAVAPSDTTDPLGVTGSMDAHQVSSTLRDLQPGQSCPRPVHERIPALLLENAIGAARRRVLEAEQVVANAATADDVDMATAALDRSVLALEKIVLCAQRCAVAIRTYNGV
jgi:hypothetical protein